MTKKILIIEDNKYNLEIAQMALTVAGFDVISAMDGKTGLKKVEEEPDLILLDLSLPRISGEEVVKNIRKNEETNDLPVIALTAHAMDGDREKTLEFGCNAYLAKPCKPADIVAKVKNFI